MTYPVTTHRDLTYAERDTGALQLDLYLPEGAPPAPVCVWLHGGGWIRGDRADRA